MKEEMILVVKIIHAVEKELYKKFSIGGTWIYFAYGFKVSFADSFYHQIFKINFTLLQKSIHA